jgi:phosphoglycerol transferase MdoB-like AlkP superfamily enzyme
MSESIGIVAAVGFFLVFAGVAYIVFRLLRKTVKVAFRMTIVAVILLIAAAGSISFWWLSNGSSKPARVERPKRNVN